MSNESFFADPKNRFCWGDCENIGDGCDGPAVPVLVFSDGKAHLMNLGDDGMPFFYCAAAIEKDERTGYRVERQEKQS